MNNKHFNKVVGNQGETIAKKYLVKAGYKIKEMNYKNPLGEIDIIAYDGEVLAFIEVKYRQNDFFGLPREAVNNNKQFRIRRVANSYINKYALHEKTCRFDVVEILGEEVTIIKDCF